MRLPSLFSTALLASALSGCTIIDGNALVTGTPRPSLSPNEVRLYTSPPPKFDEIALVYSNAGHDFLSNSKIMNSAVERLKIEAAKVGANGVILLHVKERDSVQSTVGIATGQIYGAGVVGTSQTTLFGINRGDTHTRIQGKAIYVPE